MTSKSKKLTGSASQIRRLNMIFLVIVNDLIQNQNDDTWRMVLFLRELCNIICAPALSNRQIAVLKVTTAEYVE